MKRVMVIGCPGSGKSTFSRALHEITRIPLYHLDMMNWTPNRTTVSKPVFIERLRQTIEKDSWIIDGNYGSTIKLRLQDCDTVFFLDYSLDVCLDGIMSRKGKERIDIPWVESPDDVDGEFIQFIKDYNIVSRPVVMELLDQYSEKDIYIFKTREEADGFLSELSRKFSQSL